MTVNCEDNNSYTGGVSIDLPAATDVVTLKGLDMDGLRTNFSSGTVGIDIKGAGLVHLDKIRINGLQGAGGGLLFEPTGPAKLVMSNSTVSDSGTAGNIVIRPTGGAAASAVFDRVTVSGSVFGIKADGSGQTTGTIDVEVKDSVAAHNVNNGLIVSSNAGQAQIRFKITRSSATDNGAFGAVATGAQAFMIVDGSSLTANGTGLAQLNGATVASYGNNSVNFNNGGNNTSGTITTIPLR